MQKLIKISTNEDIEKVQELLDLGIWKIVFMCTMTPSVTAQSGQYTCSGIIKVPGECLVVIEKQ